VQVIDVLGDQQKLARPPLFEASERLVGDIGLDRWVQELSTALVVELLDHGGIFAKAYQGGDLLNVMVLSKSVVVAKGLDARLGRNSCAGEDDNAGAFHIGVTSIRKTSTMSPVGSMLK
jgi:hypothetical protein